MVATQRSSQATLRRAAILLQHLDAQSQRQLLAHLTPGEVERLRRAAADLRDVDPLEASRIVRAFFTRISSAREQTAESPPGPESPAGPESPPGHRGGADLPSAERAPQGEAAEPEPSSTRHQQLQFLSEVSDLTLLQVVQQEHPQTIAVVLGALPAQQAARLLRRLAPELRSEALRRLGRLDAVPQELLDEIADHLRKTVGAIEPIEATAGGRTLTSILAELDEEDRIHVTGALAHHDGIVAAALEQSQRLAEARGATARPEATSRRGGREPEPSASARAETTRPDLRIAAETERAAKHRVAAPEHAAAEPPHERLHDDEADYILHALEPRQLRQVMAELSGHEALLTFCGLRERAAQRLLKLLPRGQAQQVRSRADSLTGLAVAEVAAVKRRAAYRALELFEPDSAELLRRQPGEPPQRDAPAAAARAPRPTLKAA